MKTLQYFSDEYLEKCKKMTPLQIAKFLEDFRRLQSQKDPSVLISLKVPQSLLKNFKNQCARKNIKYQTHIKQLMSDWLQQL